MNDATTLSRPVHEVNAVPARAPASQIVPDPRNPRKFIHPQELDELTVSIKERGLLQPILVRRISPNCYQIVFGERRWRAFILANGADAEMPILICEMTDEEALDAQIDENDVRVQPSETEQADAAARVLQNCHGDRAEAIRRLGWAASKFDRRIALTKLSPAVKAALNERRIKVGHAELLAAIHTEKQDKALATILSSSIDVAATRDLLSKMTHQLASAVFDKAECAACEFNSTLQRTLFATAVHDGACTNPACYEIKTTEAKANAKTPAVKTTATSRAKPPQTVSEPSPAIASPQAEKATDEAVATPAAVVAIAVKPTFSDAPVIESAATPIPKNPAISPIEEPEEDDKRLAAIRSTCRHKVRSIRESTWRRAVARHLSETPAHAKIALVTAAFTGQLSSLTDATLPPRASLLISPDFANADRPEQLATVMALSAEVLDRAHAAIASAFAMDVPDFSQVEALATTYNVDIRQIWTVDKVYLENFTKDELAVIAVECDLTSIIGAKDFSRITKGKRGELIAAMLTTPGFDWTGRLPSAMTLNKRYGAPPSPAVTL